MFISTGIPFLWRRPELIKPFKPKKVLLKEKRETEGDFKAQVLLLFPWSLRSYTIQIKLLKQAQLSSTDTYSQTKIFSTTDVRKGNYTFLKALTSNFYSYGEKITLGSFHNQSQKKD